MSELSKIKGEKVTMKIHGEDREIKFNFSAWADIEKEYGGFDKIDVLLKDIDTKPFQTLPKLLYFGLRNKEGVTQDTILDDYELKDIIEIKGIFEKAFYGSLPVDEGKNEGTEAKK